MQSDQANSLLFLRKFHPEWPDKMWNTLKVCANGPLSVTSHSPVATAGTFVSFQNTNNCFPNLVGAVYRFPGLNTNL